MPAEPRFTVFWPPKLMVALREWAGQFRGRGLGKDFARALAEAQYRLAFEADEWGVPIVRGPDADTFANHCGFLWLNYTVGKAPDGRAAVVVVRCLLRWQTESEWFLGDASIH